MTKKMMYGILGLCAVLFVVVVAVIFIGKNDKIDVSNSRVEEFMSEATTEDSIEVETRVPESEVETTAYPDSVTVGDGSAYDFGYTRYSYEIEEYSVDVMNTPSVFQEEAGSEGGSVIRMGDKGRPTKYKRQTDRQYTMEDLDTIFDTWVGPMQKDMKGMFKSEEPMQLLAEFAVTCITEYNMISISDFQRGQETDAFYVILWNEGLCYNVSIVEDEGEYAIISFVTSGPTGKSGIIGSEVFELEEDYE